MPPYAAHLFAVVTLLGDTYSTATDAPQYTTVSGRTGISPQTLRALWSHYRPPTFNSPQHPEG